MLPQEKNEIDKLTYRSLLYMWRFEPISSSMFQGGKGAYIQNRMAELRAAPGGEEMHIAASKSIGW
jgi:hypothetical protein